MGADVRLVSHFFDMIISNGFSWKNVVGVIFTILAIRYLHQAVTTGRLDTFWNTHLDVKTQRILFAISFVFMLASVLAFGAWALGFENKVYFSLFDDVLGGPKH